MSYQVIARKWRPQSFNELVGQNHVTQTLTNALRNGRLHHALLFTGPRGTGKTSSARILAKALRCPNAVDFVPCDHCESCIEIAQSRSPAVVELDGASNNGVDAIRELRDSVSYMPSSGKYKVYIIDEVHMLSTSAFNALLKTLEEPPSHVIFILATTEVQKLPQTILSRCQRYDFRRIPIKTVIDQLKKICDGENIPAAEEALWVIARQGDGSMRDSQSLLDQVITFANGPLTLKNTVEILGLTDRTLLVEALKALVDRDTQGVMAVLEKVASAGFEPHLFSQDLLESIRNLLVVKVSGTEASRILELPDSELQSLTELGQKVSEEDVHFLFDMALKGGNDIPKAQDPRIVLEVTLLRMAAAPKITDLESLIRGGARRRLVGAASNSSSNAAASSGTAAGSGAIFTSGPVSTTASVGAAASASTSASAPVPAPAPARPATPKFVTGDTPPEKWLAFVDEVRQDDAIFAAKIENLIFAKEDGKILLLAVPPKLAFLKQQMNDSAIHAKLQGFIDSYWGAGYSFQVSSGKEPVAGESAQSLAIKKQQQAEEELRLQIAENPMVKTAQAVFKGQIKAVTEIASKGRR